MGDEAMYADPPLDEHIAAPAPRGTLSAGLIVAFLLLWVLTVYGRTTWSMVAIWERSETFAHGFVVIPIFLYLLWDKRHDLASIQSRPFLPAFLGIIIAGAVWLVGDRLSLNSVTQFAMMAMVPLAVWAALGTQALRVLLFPLAFLFFAVPFGEFFVPPLMNWAADFAAIAIRASGVPIFREANTLTIPAGTWPVVEACGGIRYLIASFMVGCLFAYLSFRSAVRRAAFVVASFAVPVFANGLAAYMIIMLGHPAQSQPAVAADPLIYGWIFFGVVTILLIGIGAKWREDDLPRSASGRTVAAAAESLCTHRATLFPLASVLALTALWPLLQFLLHAAESSPTDRLELLRIAARDGWITAADAFSIGLGWRTAG
jgi:exosortase A